MRFFIILLLASLASTSPVSKELQDKNSLEDYLKDAMLPAEFASNNHPEEHLENDLVYAKRVLTEIFNSVSNEDAEFESVTQAKNAKANHVAQPLSKIGQSEESNEYTPAAANNVKKDLPNFIHDIKEDLKKTFEKVASIISKIVNSVPKVKKP